MAATSVTAGAMAPTTILLNPASVGARSDAATDSAADAAAETKFDAAVAEALAGPGGAARAVAIVQASMDLLDRRIESAYEVLAKEAMNISNGKPTMSMYEYMRKMDEYEQLLKERKRMQALLELLYMLMMGINPGMDLLEEFAKLGIKVSAKVSREGKKAFLEPHIDPAQPKPSDQPGVNPARSDGVATLVQLDDQLRKTSRSSAAKSPTGDTKIAKSMGQMQFARAVDRSVGYAAG